MEIKVDVKTKRKEKLEQDLDRIVHCLITSYHPEKIYLFGSLASGKVDQNSDLDLLIIKKTQKNFMTRLKEVSLLCDYDVGVDFLVYTPKELRKELKENKFLQKEIIEKAKLIYEKSS